MCRKSGGYRRSDVVTNLIPDGKISKLAALPAEFIDLTKDVASDMPLNPSDTKAIFKYVSTFERDRVNVTSFAMSTQNGAHVDAPRHFVGDGATIDVLPLTRFVGQGVALDLANGKMGSGIADTDLEPCSPVGRGTL